MGVVVVLDCRNWMGCLAAHIHRLSGTLDDVKKRAAALFLCRARELYENRRGRPGLLDSS